ncbi:D-sedoheptulose 7-phosphate isomerase [Barrientosiimonas humi]|uniref:D-sedoheptulose 7-phosphate isomerase n=1 Tax=Barrientosiimonas humi TaxID=999931 RepID=A0A542XC47_9MICO|nr:SIS domain-containing protein [Barrientosiimonas humi]TQL33306.1 D-sedoheptulose 7-phosphate isomerase [Barrientosiimonas humi]CAG7573295.1 Phosphoheptose isomerase [Barrientosiimonas humi]
MASQGLDPQHPLSDAGEESVTSRVGSDLGAGVAAWRDLAAALSDPGLSADVEAAGRAVVQALAGGSTLLVCGNGGSAAMASHVAAEFVGKCIQDRPPLPALSLAESISSLTAVGNDYGFDQVFVRALGALGRRGDVLLAMSTSGHSPNVLAALDLAKDLGITTVLMTGERGADLADRTDHLLVVPSGHTARIQEVHLLWAHAWCESIDALSQPGA